MNERALRIIVKAILTSGYQDGLWMKMLGDKVVASTALSRLNNVTDAIFESEPKKGDTKK